MLKYIIDNEKCVKCGECVEACPRNTIVKEEEKIIIKHDECIRCGLCMSVCPVDAVFTKEEKNAKQSNSCVSCNISKNKDNVTKATKKVNYLKLLTKPKFYKYVGMAIGIIYSLYKAFSSVTTKGCKKKQKK